MSDLGQETLLVQGTTYTMALIDHNLYVGAPFANDRLRSGTVDLDKIEHYQLCYIRKSLHTVSRGITYCHIVSCNTSLMVEDLSP